MTRIELDDGKYTVVHDSGAGLHALRYGEHWRDMTGDGLVLAMAQEIEDLRRRIVPVQQVSVPDGKVCVPVEVLRLYEFMAASFTPFTSQHEQIAISLRKAKAAMLAAPAAPAADAGLVEARKANNELVNDLHVMTNKRRQLVDALTYLRECLDPEDYMGEISMHDFIDDALASHRSTGVV